MNIFKIFFFLIFKLILISSILNCNPFQADNDDSETNNRNLLIAAAALSASGSSVVVSTLSLSESGKSDSKLILNQPEDLAVDANGIYVADSKNNRIIKITGESTVTSIATSSGNGGTVTVINNPEGIAIGPNNLIYVANTGASSATSGAYDGHNIISIDTSNSNTIALLSGANRPTNRETIDGSQGTNRYFKPEGIRYRNNKLIVGETGGYNVREVTTSSGTVTTLVGEKKTGGASPSGGTPLTSDGTVSVGTATFNAPKGVVADSSGNIYIVDKGNHCIRKYDPSTNTLSTFAGSRLGGSDNASSGFVDGQGTAAKFNGPYMIDIDTNGNLYVADAGNYAIRKITSAGVVTTVAGGKGQGRTDGTATSAQFYNPIGIYYYNNALYVTDVAKASLSTTSDTSTDYSTIRKITNVF
ncbi:MAG: hypothetical protein KDK36_14335 [Leptospiraceae bacterium]|nr:hypothetical protein [Leptospiraceae bacterium]